MTNTLSFSSATDMNLNPIYIDILLDVINNHIYQHLYPGCQIAIGRNNKFLSYTVGLSNIQNNTPATEDTLWCLYSNTKFLIALVIWVLVDKNVISFDDKISTYINEWKNTDKENITIKQLLTHQGGFPNYKEPSIDMWHDYKKLGEFISNIKLEWEPGSKIIYHRLSAHWVLSCLIHVVSNKTPSQCLREFILLPLQLENQIFLGVPESEFYRVSMVYQTQQQAIPIIDKGNSNKIWWTSEYPAAGAYGTALGNLALYQMILNKGQLNGIQILSESTINLALQNYTEDRIDEYYKIPMNRALGPHLRGIGEKTVGLGTLSSSGTFGHGGVGSSYCWADPKTGVCFSYLTNCRTSAKWHIERMEIISNLVHQSVL